MQYDRKQRAVYLQRAIVFNKAELTELVHEIIYTGARGTDHLCKRLLADLREDGLGSAFLAKIGQQQESTCQALLARIEQLIDQVFFDANSPCQKMGNEHLGKR